MKMLGPTMPTDPVPAVTISYFTVWVDAQGRLNFRDDVYGHDAALARELFAAETMPEVAEAEWSR